MAHFPNKLVVGLTGCIASGKTSALKLFAENHWNTISTDQIVNRLWAENDRLISSAQDRWGKDEIFSLGRIDKSKIARIIFRNPDERIWLEEFLHPIVREKWVSQIRQSDTNFFVVELPLLFEKNLNSYFNHIISVFVTEKVQLTRLIHRGLTEKEAKARMKCQIPSGEKANRADTVLLGVGSKSFLSNQIVEVSQNLSKSFE